MSDDRDPLGVEHDHEHDAHVADPGLPIAALDRPDGIEENLLEDSALLDDGTLSNEALRDDLQLGD